MTRKDFELIARTIRHMKPDIGVCYFPVIANRFADMCSAQNPRFDRERFLAACGVE